MKDRERQALVRDLWLRRPADKRTENDVLMFYGEIKDARPELLKRGRGDPYQHLMADLCGYVTF
jgi:hypothetical protein